MAEHVDVMVIGAGLSGIAAGYYLQTECPGRSYAILEMRGAIGGTWDLFRYPGIRCDSDMFSLSYPFRPWPREEVIAEGGAIRDYIEDTAREYGIDARIRFHHKVLSASWSSTEARWRFLVERTDTGEQVELTAGFLLSCSGYYDYAAGYTPDYPGRAEYKGHFVHPQRWPADLDHAGKRVVVIGSGATAVTLVPALAKTAARVTMLQRSPSYVLAIPRTGWAERSLRRVLPISTAASLLRWRNTLQFLAFYQFCRRFPSAARRLLMRGVRDQVGEGVDVDTHFNPSYDPWDQRLCIVPDGDLFEALGTGRAEVVTDTIDTFTEGGIRLASGRVLDADIVVSATGLNMKILGGVSVTVDGEPVVAPERLFYRGALLSDVPNFAVVIGYTNAAWTLKVAMVHRYLCRILNHMSAHGYDVVVPRITDPEVEPRPLIEMTSGYFERARDQLPKNGSKAPWKLYQNFLMDRIMTGRSRLEDGSLTFSRSPRAGNERPAK